MSFPSNGRGHPFGASPAPKWEGADGLGHRHLQRNRRSVCLGASLALAGASERRGYLCCPLLYNDRSTGPADGMEKSYEEILRLLERHQRPRRRG